AALHLRALHRGSGARAAHPGRRRRRQIEEPAPGTRPSRDRRGGDRRDPRPRRPQGKRRVRRCRAGGGTMTTRDATAKKTLAKIEKLAKSVVRDIQKKKNPEIQIPLRTLSNIHYSARKKIIEMGKETQDRAFFNVSQARKFMQTFLVATACKELLDSGKTTSIRDLYYMTKHTLGNSRQNTFEEQDESDPIIE